MKTISLNVYTVNELNEQAKEKAFNNCLNTCCYVDLSDEIEELKKLLSYFSFSFSSYQIDSVKSWFTLSYSYDTSEIESFKQVYRFISDKSDYLLKGKKFYSKDYKKNRVSKILKEYDYSCTINYTFIEYIFNWLQKPNKFDSIEDVINEATEKVFSDFTKEYEYLISEEYFVEDCEANEQMFFADGSLYR